MIIAAWPGIGKTWAANNIQGITDMEPDEYKRADPMDTALQTHESKPTPQHPDRLDNYIDAIWNAHRAGRTVLTTMHPSVHHALQDRGAVIATIAPRREDKDKYLKRYRTRGRTDEAITRMDAHWDESMEAIEGESTIRVTPDQYLADILPVRDGALINEVMIGDDGKLYAVDNGLLWTATPDGPACAGEVDTTARHIQGLARSWPGLTATDGRTDVLARTDLRVRPTRADQIQVGDIVRWTGLTRTVTRARPLDEESISIGFWGAAYDIPLHINHHLDVIVASRPAPLTAPPATAEGRILTEEDLDSLPLGATVRADGAIWERVPTADGSPWAGLWATTDREVYGWRLVRNHGPVTALEPTSRS